MKLRADVSIVSAALLMIAFSLSSGAGPAPCASDPDGDGACDFLGADNCTTIANPAQRDDDEDGYGNLCDKDVTQDCVVGGPDLGAIFGVFGASLGNGWNGNPLLAAYDVNEDNAVGGPDLGQTFAEFGGVPGPTSRVCAGCNALPGGCPGIPVGPPASCDPQTIQDGIPVPIQGYNVFTIGAADFDGDGRDDLYSLNHNARASLLLSTANSIQPFDTFSLLPTLLHDPSFPELVDLEVRPTTPASGALVYWHQRSLNVESGTLTQPVVGTFTFRAEPQVDESSNTLASITQVDPSTWTVDFELQSSGRLTISHLPLPAVGWPVSLSLTSPATEVSIGALGDHPQSESSFRLRDFHALVVRDLNVDGVPDIVALGGGLRGNAAALVPDAYESVFLSSGSGYNFYPGPLKDGCSSRQASWEGNDLRISCARGRNDNVWNVPGPSEIMNGPGAWLGGEVGTSTFQPGDDSCETLTATRCTLDSVFGSTEGFFCTEADFDGDGKLELVVAQPVAERSYTATYFGDPY